MNQKLFFFFHLVVVLCMALSTNNLFAQRPPRVSKNTELSKQSGLVTQQPNNGRLDVDTRTLQEGKNVVCQNPSTGKVLVAFVKKGQIVSWEVETTQSNKATARTAAATTFKATATQQYKLNPKAKTQTASNATANDVPKANARGSKGTNCSTITCEECFRLSSNCEKCKDCPSLGVKDPPILVSEGNGVIIDDDIEQQYAITNWSDSYTTISTYSYSYTPYVTIISPQMFNSMGW